MMIVAGGSTFSPLQVANLWAWYNPQLGVTDAGSGAVSAWADQSGNGRTMLQNTGSLRPTTGTRTKNGLNVLDFTTTDYVQIASQSVGMTTWTVFAMLEADADGATYLGAVVFSLATGSDFDNVNSGMIISQGDANGLAACYVNNVEAELAGAVATPFDVYTARKANAASASNMTLQKGVGDSTATATSTVTGTATVITIGARLVSNAWTQGWNGVIGDVIIYNGSVSDADRTAIQTFLSTKWGV